MLGCLLKIDSKFVTEFCKASQELNIPYAFIMKSTEASPINETRYLLEKLYCKNK